MKDLEYEKSISIEKKHSIFLTKVEEQSKILQHKGTLKILNSASKKSLPPIQFSSCL